MATTVNNTSSSAASAANNTTPKNSAHNANLIKQGEQTILNLNASDKQVYDFLQKAFANDDTDPATLSMLQQMLQKRMEKVGLISNLLKQLGESMMRVIQNIGR